MHDESLLTIDRRVVPINGARNLLETARSAGIEIPTFCYHSEMSVHGACRLCLVEVEGMGIVASCSTQPMPGMKVRTNTEEIRRLRRVAVELLLANHQQQCTTCGKSAACQLQRIARRVGIDQVRYKPTQSKQPIDASTPSLVRDPNKCILCGDCVRACDEIQGIGAIDFAHRGAAACVAPAFGKTLNEVECVYCGQCAAVCPTGAVLPRDHTAEVWRLLEDPAKKVVVQIAPAVRVALGEMFGGKPGEIETGRIAAALRALGFDRVFDTSFTADMTVLEEAREFIERKQAGGPMPQFTSCCPAWVKFAEHFFPSLLPNLSSCRSPQQMFGALAREILPEQLGCRPEELAVVSIMPCTAKKYEAQLPKFSHGGRPDVDYVLTTQELGRMIEEAGIDFDLLQPESLDMPLGFKTGAGVIFGTSGGVTEAVLRCAAERLAGVRLETVEFQQVRGCQGVHEATVTAGAATLRLAIVHGLRNARTLARKVLAGEASYDLVEVMACPGGCVGGAGQPWADRPETRRRRAQGLYMADKMLDLHKSQDNPMLAECYSQWLGEVGGPRAHHLLHTKYQSRRRIGGGNLVVLDAPEKLRVSVCMGTSCLVRGSQTLLRQLLDLVAREGWHDRVQLEATFCFEKCDRGPTLQIGARVINRCTLDTAWQAIREAVGEEAAASP